jgi:polyphosphate kinase
VFDAAMAPGVRCWELGPDGGWARTGGEHDYQAELMAWAGDRVG